MKFRKLIFGLAVTPFLLASCNNALTLEQAQKWVAENYKTAVDLPAVAYISWDFHGTVGDKAKNGVEKVLTSLGEEQEKEGVKGLIPTRADFEKDPIGHVVKWAVGGDDIKVKQLNKDTFKGAFSDDPAKDVYKIDGGCFNVTYKYSELYDDENKVETVRVRKYNQQGYCTDFGCKVNGKWVDDDNTIKFKVLIHFTYQTDPFE